MGINERKYFKSRSNALVLVFVFLFFLLIRAYRLGYHDFWYDEFTTFLSVTNRPWLIHPPLYYHLLFVWEKIFGASEIALRFPSVIFSGLSLYLVYRLGKKLFQENVGFFAAVIMGLSGFQLWYAQEARNYTMVLFLSLASTLLLLKALEKGKWIYWAYFCFVSAAGLSTHYFYIFLIFVHLIWILLIKRARGIFLIALLSIGIGLLFFPNLFPLLKRFNIITNGHWINTPDWQSVLFTFENLILGYHGTALLYGASNLICFMLFIFSLGNLRDKACRKNFLFCLLLFFTPLLTAFVFSKILFSVYLDRGFIIISPYWYIILSAGIVYMPKKLRLGLFSGFLILFLTTDYRYFKDEMAPLLKHHNGVYTKNPMKPLARFLSENFRKNEDKLVFTNLSGCALGAYCKIDFFQTPLVFSPEVRDEDTKKPFVEARLTIPCQKLSATNFKRLWVFASDWGRTGELDDNSRAVKKWLDENFNLFFSRNFDGTWLYGYEQKR